MRLTLFSRLVPLILLAFGLTSCGDEAAPEEGHTPANAALFLNGVNVSNPGPLSIGSGQTVRVEVKFFAEDGDEITGIDDDHFTRVNVVPAGLVTTGSVTGEHFQVDITAGAEPGNGTYTIGYGHTDVADELSFGIYEIVVTAPTASR